MTHKSELTALRFAGAVVLGVLLAAVLIFFAQGRRPQVANPQGEQALQPVNPVEKQPVEQEAGGVLEGGAWKFGYTPKPEETRKFVRGLAKPTIVEAGPDVLRMAKRDKPIFLYRALYEAYAASHGGEQWYVLAQGIGDCVSWGWAHGSDVHLAVQWKLGETAEWLPAATEAIYGGSRVEARGINFAGYSDGSYGAAAAKWTRDWGIVFRQPFPELGLDLSTYSSQRAKEWGAYGCGGRGDNGQLDNAAKRHPIRGVTLVRDFNEAAAAIESGYPVPVCSGQGFSSRRDTDGFCAADRGWSHCMCFIAVRYAPRPGLLCLNSWGTKWVSGPKWPDDQPEGSFWVDADVATRMLRGGDSFSVSALAGFPHRDLAHGDWVLVEPVRLREYHQRLATMGRGKGTVASDKFSYAYSLAP